MSSRISLRVPFMHCLVLSYLAPRAQCAFKSHNDVSVSVYDYETVVISGAAECLLRSSVAFKTRLTSSLPPCGLVSSDTSQPRYNSSLTPANFSQYRLVELNTAFILSFDDGKPAKVFISTYHRGRGRLATCFWDTEQTLDKIYTLQGLPCDGR